MVTLLIISVQKSEVRDLDSRFKSNIGSYILIKSKNVNIKRLIDKDKQQKTLFLYLIIFSFTIKQPLCLTQKIICLSIQQLFFSSLLFFNNFIETYFSCIIDANQSRHFIQFYSINKVLLIEDIFIVSALYQLFKSHDVIHNQFFYIYIEYFFFSST